MTSPEQPSSRQADCVWVLASGPATDVEAAIRHAATPDIVIAADGGTVLAKRLGITPALIVGDLDSTPSELASEYANEGVEIRRYEHITKWETDTELALLAALEYSPRQIFILGASGGRLDHSLANVLLLTHPQLAPLDVHILDGIDELFLAKPQIWNNISGRLNDIVSLLPLGVACARVTTRGLHWPLNVETLPEGRGRGVSNRIEDTTSAAVRYESGQLLVAIVHET